MAKLTSSTFGGKLAQALGCNMNDWDFHPAEMAPNGPKGGSRQIYRLILI